jgi:hypothetical protein
LQVRDEQGDGPEQGGQQLDLLRHLQHEEHGLRGGMYVRASLLRLQTLSTLGAKKFHFLFPISTWCYFPFSVSVKGSGSFPLLPFTFRSLEAASCFKLDEVESPMSHQTFESRPQFNLFLKFK